MNPQAPAVTPTEPVAPTAPTAPVIDIKQSATSQADKILRAFQAKAPTEPTPPPSTTPPPPVPTGTEPAAQVPTTPAADATLPSPQPILPDEDDEEPVPAPVDLGTATKYVMDRLPTLTTRIMDGEQQKIIQFKDPSELPLGFKFADDTAASQFAMDAAAQVTRADKLLTQYNTEQMNQRVQAFKTQEDQDVASDLSRLQRQGVIPTFKYEETDPLFNSDPAVKTANEIYDLFKKTNEAYARKYANSNRTFRISYADAADKYFAAQNRANTSQVAKEQPTAPEKTPIQKEREEIASKTGSPQGAEAVAERPKAKAGMTMNDVNRLVKAGRI